ncbi:invasion associated locus B family protein [Ruegeria sp. MALMAid1280]|uniref:invasion associated locus B family protein n=1 Tax=Ruegeria sp. MALMAid1280 TaxID=3411634 RepID=UPI003B9E68A3
MIKKLLSFNVMAAVLCCGGVYAQETTQESQPAAETPQTGAGTELDLGESGPRVGEQYVKEKAGDWSVTCINTDTDNDPCALRQILLGPQRQPIAEITIEKLAEGTTAVAGATVIVPLEILLQAQLAFSIDGAPGKRYDYQTCTPVGCIAQLGFTQGDVDAMKAGSKAKLSMVSVHAPNQLVELEMSLSGFTSGFDGLNANQN